MQRKFLALSVAASLALAACGSATTDSTVSQISKDPQVQKDQQALYDQAESCFKGPRSLSKSGREKFMACFLPEKRRAAGRVCMNKQVKEQGIPLSRKRAQFFLQQVSHCIVVSK